MAGTTYSKFFWQDWAGDAALILCSPGAQALWMRMLALASQADPAGHVKMPNGTIPTIDDLVVITRFSGEAIPGWIEELKNRGVCDTGRDGVLISRRMVRDARKQRARAAGGRSASLVSARTETGNFSSRSDVHQQPAPATINHQPSTINHQPQKQPPKISETMAKVGRLGSALGFDPTTARNGHRFIEDLVRLEADGFDFDLDILPTIDERRVSGSIPRDLGSLAYFRKAIDAKKQSRLVADAVAQERAAAPFEDVDAHGWSRRLDGWLDSGYWPPQYGPRPRSGGCKAPPVSLADALQAWEAQGGHPQGSFPADPNGRFTAWKDLRDLRNNPDVDYGNRQLGANVVAMPRRTA